MFPIHHALHTVHLCCVPLATISRHPMETRGISTTNVKDVHLARWLRRCDKPSDGLALVAYTVGLICKFHMISVILDIDVVVNVIGKSDGYIRSGYIHGYRLIKQMYRPIMSAHYGNMYLHNIYKNVYIKCMTSTFILNEMGLIWWFYFTGDWKYIHVF